MIPFHSMHVTDSLARFRPELLALQAKAKAPPPSHPPVSSAISLADDDDESGDELLVPPALVASTRSRQQTSKKRKMAHAHPADSDNDDIIIEEPPRRSTRNSKSNDAKECTSLRKLNSHRGCKRLILGLPLPAAKAIAACPVCQAEVPIGNMNRHLDSGCKPAIKADSKNAWGALMSTQAASKMKDGPRYARTVVALTKLCAHTVVRQPCK